MPAVVLFHAGVPGGFVGVDVFFVLSGFLITGLLWREVGTTGQLRAACFHAARARRLPPAAITALVMGPVADPHVRAPACLSGHLDSATACAPARSAAVNAPGIAAEDAATRAGGGDYWDVSNLFCPTDRCPLIVGNDLVYRDDNHVTVEYASVPAPVVAAEIAAVLPGG